MPVLKGLLAGLALGTAISGGALALCVKAASADDRNNTSNDWSNNDNQWRDNRNWRNQDAFNGNKDDTSAFGIAAKDTAIGSQNKTQRDDNWWNDGWFNNNSWRDNQDNWWNHNQDDRRNQDRDFARDDQGTATPMRQETPRGEDDEPSADALRDVEEQPQAQDVADVEQVFPPPMQRRQVAPPPMQQDVAPPPVQRQRVAPPRGIELPQFAPRRVAPPPTRQRTQPAMPFLPSSYIAPGAVGQEGPPGLVVPPMVTPEEPQPKEWRPGWDPFTDPEWAPPPRTIIEEPVVEPSPRPGRIRPLARPAG